LQLDAGAGDVARGAVDVHRREIRDRETEIGQALGPRQPLGEPRLLHAHARLPQAGTLIEGARLCGIEIRGGDVAFGDAGELERRAHVTAEQLIELLFL
jgi:hypothetical protein